MIWKCERFPYQSNIPSRSVWDVNDSRLTSSLTPGPLDHYHLTHHGSPGGLVIAPSRLYIQPAVSGHLRLIPSSLKVIFLSFEWKDLAKWDEIRQYAGLPSNKIRTGECTSRTPFRSPLFTNSLAEMDRLCWLNGVHHPLATLMLLCSLAYQGNDWRIKDSKVLNIMYKACNKIDSEWSFGNGGLWLVFRIDSDDLDMNT